MLIKAAIRHIIVFKVENSNKYFWEHWETKSFGVQNLCMYTEEGCNCFKRDLVHGVIYCSRALKVQSMGRKLRVQAFVESSLPTDLLCDFYQPVGCSLKDMWSFMD